MLGTRTQRIDGKTRFERSGLAHRVHPKRRAFNLGVMVQQPRQTDAPAASMKVYHRQLNAYQQSNKVFLEVGVGIVCLYCFNQLSRFLRQQLGMS